MHERRQRQLRIQDLNHKGLRRVVVSLDRVIAIKWRWQEECKHAGRKFLTDSVLSPSRQDGSPTPGCFDLFPSFSSRPRGSEPAQPQE